MVMAEDRLDELKQELDIINGSFIGGKNIDQVNDLNDIVTTNTRTHLFSMVKELYKFAEKAVMMISSETAEPTESVKLEDLIKKQLTEVLPGLLQSALKEQMPLTKETPKEVEVKSRTVHTLLVEKKSDNEDDKITENEWVRSTKSDVKTKLQKVKVLNAAASNGTATLRFETKQHLDQAKKALQEEYKVTPTSEEKKKLNPKLSISDIDRDINSKELLMSEILDKDNRLKALKDEGETLEVSYFHKEQRYAVIQVSPKIREIIRANGDRMSIGLMYYNVRDRIHVIQCYHCQQYGHMAGSPYCKQKGQDATCFYCAGSHASKDCRKKLNQDKHVKCSNCAQSKNRSESAACTTHKASDTLCPFYIRERVRVMSRTAGCEEAKNFYIKKTQELRQRLGRL